MAAAVSSAPAKRTWGDFKSQKTKAVPKHTLFGANIEMLDPEDREAVGKLDVEKFQRKTEEERRAKQERYKVQVPEHMKDKLQGDALEHTKEELKKQLHQTARARQLMDVLDEKSKYFAVGSRTEPNQHHEPTKTNSNGWMTDNDLEHARDINIVGLGGTSSFNHQKYQSKAPVHKYTLAADPLKFGMDAPALRTVSPPRRPYYRVERYGPPDRMPKEFYMKHAQEEKNDDCAVKLPPNIKHQFGTTVCNKVLSDSDKVQNTMEKQKKLKESFQKSAGGSFKRRPRHSVLDEDIDPSYDSLGKALRQDFFLGHTYNHKKSLARSVYTEDVHKQRVSDPDQYRYQKDELSTWAEQNVLRERMKKAWDTYLTDTLSSSKN